MRGCIDPDVSMASPTDSGRFVTCSNFATFTGLPSSSTLKESWPRSFTGRPPRSTVVGNSTRWTLTSSVNPGVLIMTTSSMGGWSGTSFSEATARKKLVPSSGGTSTTCTYGGPNSVATLVSLRKSSSLSSLLPSGTLTDISTRVRPRGFTATRGETIRTRNGSLPVLTATSSPVRASPFSLTATARMRRTCGTLPKSRSRVYGGCRLVMTFLPSR